MVGSVKILAQDYQKFFQPMKDQEMICEQDQSRKSPLKETEEWKMLAQSDRRKWKWENGLHELLALLKKNKATKYLNSLPYTHVLARIPPLYHFRA